MKRWIFLILSLCIFSQLTLTAQQSIDGRFRFQSDPNKAFSLYIPSNYEPNGATKAALCLHPFNTSRWNAKSWRDTLIRFAEMNDLLLICPDGGLDGRIDDSIDTAFTSFLLDSVYKDFPYDRNTLVALGFSRGGRTVYSYGLRRPQKFVGYIPIGAAIDGQNYSSLYPNAAYKPVFIIHGTRDNKRIRFDPAYQGLMNVNACVQDSLLQNIGHTIDFPNRNDILSHAYQSILESPCLKLATQETSTVDINIRVNRETITIYSDIGGAFNYSATSINGQNVLRGTIHLESGRSVPISTTQISQGNYFFSIWNNKWFKAIPFILH